MDNDNVHQDALVRVKSILEPLGFECHPFKVGWYNDQVLPAFKLPYDREALALIILSTPSMFDKALKPYISRNDCSGVRDPVDECISHQFQIVQQSMPDTSIDKMFDYERDHNRRPKILVQTAGHVAGAARYYQRSDIQNDPWDAKKKYYGVSIHPKYGGWFAFRGVLIFKDIRATDLEQKEPPDPVSGEQDRIQLLIRYNDHWRDGSFRDIIIPQERYSAEQKLYFDTLPKDRPELVAKMKSSLSNET